MSDDIRGGYLGEILVESSVISKEELNKAIELQKKSYKNVPLGEILVQKGWANPEDISKALAVQFNLPFVRLSDEQIDEEPLHTFSANIIQKYNIFPLKVQGRDLTVAVVNPLDIFAIQGLKHMSGYRIMPVVTTKEEIDKCVNKYYNIIEKVDGVIGKAAVDRAQDQQAEKKDELDIDKLKDAAEEAPVVKLVNTLLTEAIIEKVSDVHFEPRREYMGVRYRLDGVLYEKAKVPKKLQLPTISRIKVISGLDISEKRKPQDGRMSIVWKDRELDIRVSTLPDIYGEKVVLRILDKSNVLLSLDKLGLDEEKASFIRDFSDQPYGIILITGPTGSGKSTTLYSILNRLNSVSRNIVTVEDPVEYELDGINQTAVNPPAGYTFATGIRHILRQDPDVIMIGEIRDFETAEIAVQSALTGHLVLSTLHTNNASGAMTRLLQMGIEPFLISSSVIGVIAQRLVRLLCPFCKEVYIPDESIIKKMRQVFGEIDQENITLARPNGCEKCKDVGYKGREGIFEILNPSRQVQDIILKRASTEEIQSLAKKEGLQTLQESGFKKALDKRTSLEEAMRVVLIRGE